MNYKNKDGKYFNLFYGHFKFKIYISEHDCKLSLAHIRFLYLMFYCNHTL